jgi:peroxiredoxin
MKVVNNEITSENLKNELLARKLWGSLMSNYMSEDNFKEVHDYFFEYCSDDKYRSEIKKSIKQKEQLKRGDKLPDVVAINVNGEEVNINNLTKDNDVVIYFWPKHLGYADMLQEKLTSLQDKYPDVLFIGIERDKSNEEWIKFIKSKKLSKDNQFMLSKNSESYAYFEGDMARTIIVKSNGNIHNGYLFFNDKNFDEQLKKLNKQ